MGQNIWKGTFSYHHFLEATGSHKGNCLLCKLGVPIRCQCSTISQDRWWGSIVLFLHGSASWSIDNHYVTMFFGCQTFFKTQTDSTNYSSINSERIQLQPICFFLIVHFQKVKHFEVWLKASIQCKFNEAKFHIEIGKPGLRTWGTNVQKRNARAVPKSILVRFPMSVGQLFTHVL